MKKQETGNKKALSYKYSRLGRMIMIDCASKG